LVELFVDFDETLVTLFLITDADFSSGYAIELLISSGGGGGRDSRADEASEGLRFEVNASVSILELSSL
jgi:hypothetical protein